MNKSTSRGRRPGSPETRERIREAARQLFLADGYQAVSLRSIAAAAEVDVALVSYYFGSKQGLFAATMALPLSPADIFQQVIAGDLDTLPERALRSLLGVWDAEETGGPLRALAMTAVADPEVTRLLRELVSRELVDLLAERLGDPEGRERAGAFVAQMSGLIFSRYLLRLEPIATMTADEVVRRLAPSLEIALHPAGR
jgi:AcrR family transcriptional regulator